MNTDFSRKTWREGTTWKT